METAPLGVIAGTGFSHAERGTQSFAGLEDAASEHVGTDYGRATITRGTWAGRPVVFLPRHGPAHELPPHRINYRANLRALRRAGCTDVVAVSVTGGIREDLVPGSLVALSDFLDFTKSREHTFFDGTSPEGVVHTEVTTAYDPDLRAELVAAAARAGRPIHDGGVYACFEGPRFESPAEIRMARTLGADVVGMTGVPEVTLAVEAGMRYAGLSLVVNPAAGLGDGPISEESIDAVITAGREDVLAVLRAFVEAR
jgi:5'-methylthioadenosine phosphorylase